MIEVEAESQLIPSEVCDKVIADLGLLCQQTEGALDITHVQGFLGERIVAGLLGDEERVGPLLAIWREAELSGKGPQKAAAHHPDWLILDGEGRITTVVEVKAVPSDKPSVDRVRNEYMEAWGVIGSLMAGVDREAWQERVTRAWRTNGQKFAYQTMKHLDRLGELVKAGILMVVENPKAILFVPSGQDYSEVPPAIKFRNDKDQIIEAPLEIRRLPSMSELRGTMDKAKATVSLEEQPEVALAEGREVSSPAKHVTERAERMVELFEPLTALLGTEDPRGQDRNLAIMVLGEETIQNTRRKDRQIAANDPEGVLQALGSTAPSLISHFLFEAAGKKIAGASKDDRAVFDSLITTRGLTLEKEDKRALLGVLTKLRNKLSNKGYPLLSFGETTSILLGD